MKFAIFLTLAMASLAQAGPRKQPVAAAVSVSTPVPAASTPAASPAAAPPASPTVPSLNPIQSNPPDPGNAFQPRTQSGCLSNIGIAQPTGGAYYHQGDPINLVILADAFLPQSNTVADIIDGTNNTVATLIPSFPMLNFTTTTTAIPFPTAMTPGTYSVRFHQTYSNTFASGVRSQTMQLKVIIVSSGAALPAPLPTTSVNALGITVAVPRAAAATAATASSPPGATPLPGGGSAAGSSNAAAPTNPSASGSSTVAAPSSAATFINSFSLTITIMLGFIGFLAAL